MPERADIVLCGTGNFAARILFDLAATAPRELSVAVVGRNAFRAAWLRTAAAARAAMFGTGVRVIERVVDTLSTDNVASLLTELQPRIVVNTASAQGGRAVDARPDGWTRLTQRGGLGVTAILQARLSLEVSRAVAVARPRAHFVNCCYPDVVNAMIAAAGLPITCGIGNVAILAHAFAGLLGPGHGRLQMLAQHAALAAFRRPPVERAGKAAPRVWLNGQELADVFDRFAAVQLAPEPVIDISGASGVPLFVAMLQSDAWRGHVPGPGGLPGGYPVALRNGEIELDLPVDLTRDQAVAWNAAFEAADGVVVSPDGQVRYTGQVEAVMRAASPDLARGFAMGDFAEADRALTQLRAHLRASRESDPTISGTTAS
jgi:hypothetical protein